MLARDRRQRSIRHVLDEAMRNAVREVVTRYPSVRQKEISDFVTEFFPVSAGTRAEPMFHAEDLRAAHDALVTETGWDCRAVCQELANRLFVDAKTIDNYRHARSFRRRPRRKKGSSGFRVGERVSGLCSALPRGGAERCATRSCTERSWG